MTDPFAFRLLDPDESSFRYTLTMYQPGLRGVLTHWLSEIERPATRIPAVGVPVEGQRVSAAAVRLVPPAGRFGAVSVPRAGWRGRDFGRGRSRGR